MVAIFITYGQALHEEITAIMDHQSIKGFTGWETVSGCGSRGGEPHLGTHAWPTMNSAIYAVVEKSKADRFIEALSALDKENGNLGLRAFWWNIEGSI